MSNIIAVIGATGVGKTHFIKERYLVGVRKIYKVDPFPHYVTRNHVIFGRYAPEHTAMNEGTDSMQSKMAPIEIASVAIGLFERYKKDVVIDGHMIMQRQTLLYLHVVSRLEVIHLHCSLKVAMQHLKVRGSTQNFWRVHAQLKNAVNLARYAKENGISVKSINTGDVYENGSSSREPMFV